MANVNATALLCENVGTIDGKVVSLNGLFDSFVPVEENGKYYIENMCVVLNSSIIFDDKFENDINSIQLSQEYEWRIRLTHIESGLGVTLDSFNLTIENEDLRTWCKNFCELKRIIRIPHLHLPKGLGNYAIKLLIGSKDENDELRWTTQTIHSLIVGGSR